VKDGENVDYSLYQRDVELLSKHGVQKLFDFEEEELAVNEDQTKVNSMSERLQRIKDALTKLANGVTG
jgi:hypothetical protein